MTCFIPTPGVHAVSTRDGAVLLHLSKGRLYGLNPTAAALWNRIHQGEDLHALSQDLAPDLGVDADRLHTDVLALIRVLSGLGLITAVRSTP